MKRALIIRHTPYEGVAGFREPIEAAGYAIHRIDVTEPDFTTADFLSPDLVVVMGGPMGVYEREAHPWIACEINRLAIRIGRGLPTLGICLGSQMIAAALGAEVYAGPIREVGFAAIGITPAGERSPLRHLAGVPVLHWHGDTFDLPPQVEVLARTAAYMQAYRRGDHLLAIQCHPEMGEDPRIEDWLEDEAYIASAGTTAEAVAQDYRDKGPAAVAAGRAVVAEWLSGFA